MKLFHSLRFLLLGLLLSASGFLFAQPVIVAGPMQGHTTDTEIRIWIGMRGMETLTASLGRASQLPHALEWRRNPRLQRWKDYEIATFTFEKLAPNTTYTLRLKLNGVDLQRTWEFTTLSTLPAESWSFLAGSCVYQGKGLANAPQSKTGTTIFKAMNQETRAFMLWMGDNNYYVKGEWDSRKKLMEKLLRDRMDVNLAAFLQQGIHYAITDDHDFGPNNCDGSYKAKDVSTGFFREAWPNPYAREDGKGNYFSFRYQDAEFFMLDDRYYRVNDSTQILGPEQMNWLTAGLKKSTAAFRFVCLGSQVINEKNPHETWYKHGRERGQFFGFLREHKIPGVVFLSGDRHFTELQKLEGVLDYPLYDLTCSPLTSWVRTKTAHDAEAENAMRLPGTLTLENNYVKITIQGPAGARECVMDVRNVSGKTLWTYTLRQTELR